MKTMFRAFSALLLLSLIASLGFAGAGNRAGTGGATELLIPTGTRDIAMGGSTVSATSGIEALFWNPAGVAKAKSDVSLMFSHMSYIADIGVDFGAVAANFEGIGVVSLSVKSLSIGDIPVTTTLAPDGTGQMFTPQFFNVGLGYARQLTDRISVGLLGMLVSERMADVSATGFAINVGVMYDNLASLQGLSLGLVVKNIGPQMKFDGPGLNYQATVSTLNRGPTFYRIDAASFELPSTFEFGIGYKRPIASEHYVQITGTFQNNNFSDDEYKLGAEFAFQDVFFVRGGYDFAQKESDQREYIYGMSMGFGMHYVLGTVDLTIDYAYRDLKYFEGNHMFSLKVGL
jgi:hypothetical protein